MGFMHLIACIALLFYVLFAHIAETTARPFTDVDTFISTPLDIDRHFNSDNFAAFQNRPVAPKDSLLNRLRRGYYYIEDGEIIPIGNKSVNEKSKTAARRQDIFSNEKIENTKPKKLFVPNLFG